MSKYHHGNLRQALLDAAALELEHKGIEALSLRQVAKRTGVSHAAPAKHFKTANDLLTALAAQSFRTHLATIEDAVAVQGPNPMDRLVAGGMAYVTYAAEHPNMFDLQFNSKRPDRNNHDLTQAGSAAFGIVIALAQGVLPQERATEAFDLATSLWVFLHGLACLSANGVLQRLEDPVGTHGQTAAGSAAHIEGLIRAEVERTFG